MTKGMRENYFDIDVQRLSNTHIVALTIFDDLYYNAETEEKIARAYGKDANLDLKRTDLYFTMTMYPCQTLHHTIPSGVWSMVHSGVF